MDPIQSVGVPLPVKLPSTGAASQAIPGIPQPNDTAGVPQQPQEQVDIQAAEKRRYEAVVQAARDIANVYVVGDKRFTIFKDATGQYITRFTSLRDGRVTYIPEPQLFELGGGSARTAVRLEA